MYDFVCLTNIMKTANLRKFEEKWGEGYTTFTGSMRKTSGPRAYPTKMPEVRHHF